MTARLSLSLICATLPVDRVRSLVEQLGIPGKRRSREDLTATLSASSSAALPRLLELASRDDLKELCRACELDDSGREKALIISRLTASINPQSPRKVHQAMATTKNADDEPNAKSLAEPEEKAGDEADDDGSSDDQGGDDGFIYDWITDQPVKDTPREQVVQRVARVLFHQYNIAPGDMQRDFTIPEAGKRGRGRKVDIAIFASNQPKTLENLRRVVVCRPEPGLGKRGSIKLRDYEQAEEDLQLVKEFLTSAENATYGLWTNGLEQFFIEKIPTRFDPKFEPSAGWPSESGETVANASAGSHSMRKADRESLRFAFRRCHNFLHGNEGHGKEQAFRQFLILIFCKLHDERRPSKEERLFRVGFKEPFDDNGRRAIRKRIQQVFEEVKQRHKTLFSPTDVIELSDRALAFIVAELSRYDFLRTPLEAKGAAYQEIVGPNLRGDLGQYFTPPQAIKLLVDMVDPGEDDKIIDPACGTGGFLVACVAHQRERMKAGDGTAEIIDTQQRLGQYVQKCVHGCDFNEFLVKASRMNLVMGSDQPGNLFHMNSLEFPDGNLTSVKSAREKIPLGSMDVVFANPPFGKNIPITERNIIENFDLGHSWEGNGQDGFRKGNVKASVEPQVLFLERCLEWLKPGGKLGIVLPDGILGAPGTAYIRWWVMQRAYVLGSVKLPVECFIVEANVNILTSLLVLKKKTEAQQFADASKPPDYPVFMAIAENVGYDRRGNKKYVRYPDGSEVIEKYLEKEERRIKGVLQSITFERRRPKIDDDLPKIADAYREFRAKYREPGT